MKIGIDISQLAYSGTGVATYLQNLIEKLIASDKENEYILFYSSLRKNLPTFKVQHVLSRNITIRQFRFPPMLLDILWNRLHILPIEWFIGPIDVFISSDWTQPPSKAKKLTIVYDMVVYTYPRETAQKIVDVQKRRLHWVKKEIDKIICISYATKKDIVDILHIPENRISIVYPGI